MGLRATCLPRKQRSRSAAGKTVCDAALRLILAPKSEGDVRGELSVQVRVVVRGAETVLGDAASMQELFLTTQLLTRLAISA